ncbi:MAG: TIGR01906 family membrane protein [Clostridia bacterium]|jgi:integral membrane protein (TIGR01906 family)
MRRIWTYTGAVLASFCLCLVLLLTGVELTAFNLNYYRNEYRKLERPQAIGISEEELMSVTRELLDYLKDQRDDLDLTAVIKGGKRPVFNEREILHMKDVKDLFRRGYRLRNISIFLIAVFGALTVAAGGKRSWKALARSFIAVAAVNFGLILLLVILLHADFTKYFDQFHYLFFTNDLWQLDPSRDVLIQMVPEAFFFDTAIRIIVFFVTAMAFLSAVSWVSLQKKPRQRGRE